MPRKPRELSDYLHVVVRGIGKQALFVDNQDRMRYLFFLKYCMEENNVTILAYCLMENHVHLLVKDEMHEIASFMKRLGVLYALYFNEKYERVGHLFQDRFKSCCITSETYLLSAYRYILYNPQEAGLCAARYYKWSSYHEFGNQDELTDTSLLYELLGGPDGFKALMQKDDKIEHLEADKIKHDDEWALSLIQKTLHVQNGFILQNMEKIERERALLLLRKAGISIRQLERLTGLSRRMIQQVKG